MLNIDWLKRVENTSSLNDEKKIPPTRRNFFKLSFLGLVSWNPVMNLLTATLSDQIKVRKGLGKVTFLLNDELAWCIDRSDFPAGSSVRFHGGGDLYLLELSNARMPGVGVSLDMKARLMRNSGTWNIHISIEGLGIDQQCGLVEWLKGERINGFLKETVDLKFSTRSAVKLGRQSVHLDKDWNIYFDNGNRVRFKHEYVELNVSKAIVRMPRLSTTQLLKGDRVDLCEIQFPDLYVDELLKGVLWNRLFALSANRRTLNGVRILVGDEDKEGGRMAHLLSVQKKDASISFHPELADENGTLNLTNGLLWINYGSMEVEYNLLASVDRQAAWNTSFRESLYIAGNDEIRNFQLRGTCDHILDFQCGAQLLGMALPVQHATSLPVYLSKPAYIGFSVGKLSGGTDEGEVNYDPQIKQVKIKLKKSIQLKVLRPEDFMVLEFEFFNFKYIKKEQFSFLEIDNKKKPASMIVHFQSQHLMEEAFWEKNALGGENTQNPQLPVRKVRSGKSRLVYDVPSSYGGMPLNMKDILNWSEFTLRINPRARITFATIVEPLKRFAVGTTKSKKKIVPKRDMGNKYSVRAVENRGSVNRKEDLYTPEVVQNMLPAKASSQYNKSVIASVAKKALLVMGPPKAFETSIEAPTRLMISPNQTGDFFHERELEGKSIIISSGNGVQNTFIADSLHTNKAVIYELWHSQLGVKLKDGQVAVDVLPGLRTIRALWARDARKNYKDRPPANQPFLTALDSVDRHQIVHESSNYLIKGYTPKSVNVNRLMLTGLGAWIDFIGNFNYPDLDAIDDLDLLLWEHRSTLGRDHYVKVVRAGYLFPFGHKAALVKITERKLDDGTRSALNRVRMFIVVLEKNVEYGAFDPQNKFIPFNFSEVRLNTSYTPNIDPPGEIISFGGDYNFWVNVNGAAYSFDFTMTDKEGSKTKMLLPLIFVGKSSARKVSRMEQLANIYNAEFNRANAGFANQMVAYADSLVPEDTYFETKSIRFGAMAKNWDTVKFHPTISSAQVFVKEIAELTGNKDAVQIQLEDDRNDAGLFASLISGAALDFSGGTDSSGGFAAPNTAIKSLSKLQGPIGGTVDKMKDLDFDPEEFFGSLVNMPMAKLFGVINIFELIFGDININNEADDFKGVVGGLTNQISDAKDELVALQAELQSAAEDAQEAIEQQIEAVKAQLTSFASQIEDAVANATSKIPNLKVYKTDSAMMVEYAWIPELEASKSLFGGFLIFNVQNPTEAMQIKSKLKRPFDISQKTEMGVSGEINDFDVELKELIRLAFEQIKFTAGSGQKSDVKVRMAQDDPFLFLGPLTFINKLQEIIPGNGFSDGPYIKISPSGVKAGYDLPIPSVEVGVCSIANISLGASVRLPFTGEPLTFSFNFCKRESPFMLTISCFGGGGYFILTSSVKSFVSMEAAFEFGAAISINLGVASGGVSVMGGFYFKMEIVDENTQTTLTGYIRINGHLSILGLIGISLEFYLAFVAMFEGDKVKKLYGEATVKVKVEVLFFSKTVKVTCRRELKGNDADPKFIEMIDQQDWLDYCSAFAEAV
ncbi:hypothetical protein EYV94_23960 [Puteibacter caeruleilacunae]|nr:hypothetical protein EYV94_23960 [Puteibacter caeruleilacunae]